MCQVFDLTNFVEMQRYELQIEIVFERQWTNISETIALQLHSFEVSKDF